MSIDTLRADHVARAPFLAGLAREGRSFSSMYASSTWTLPSHVSLLTSLPYREHDLPPPGSRAPHAGARLSPRQSTLASVLAAAGYATVATTEGGWVSRPFGLGVGFERFEEVAPRSQGNRDARSRHLDFVREALEASSGPLFAFVHTYWAHDYFVNESDYHGALEPEDAPNAARGNLLEYVRGGGAPPSPDFVKRLYAAGVIGADALLRDLVTAIRRQTADAPLVVIVTSDHGESLGEWPGGWGHGGAPTEERLQIPLVVWSNRETAWGDVVDVPSSTIDVAPSLLRWLGLPIPQSFRGASDRLLDEPRPSVVFARAVESEPGLRGQSHLMALAGRVVYHRSDSFAGRTTSEGCAARAGFASDALESECARLRRLASRALANGSRRALAISASQRLELRMATESGVVVQASDPSAVELRDDAGRLVDWTPESTDSVLLVYPGSEGFALSRVRVGDRVVARDLGLAEITSAGPAGARYGSGDTAVTIRSPVGFGGDPSATPLDEQLTESLRALGYLE